MRCSACGTTQALLPWFVVPRRWDIVEVIGRALQLLAEGWGHRRIAEALARPETTVRAWCRRWRWLVVGMAGELLAKAVSWGWSGWELPSSPLLRCLAALEALSGQWSRRHGPVRSWRLANLITGGLLPATNRTLPLAGEGAGSSMSAKSIWEVPNGP